MVVALIVSKAHVMRTFKTPVIVTQICAGVFNKYIKNI